MPRYLKHPRGVPDMYMLRSQLDETPTTTEITIFDTSFFQDKLILETAVFQDKLILEKASTPSVKSLLRVTHFRTRKSSHLSWKTRFCNRRWISSEPVGFPLNRLDFLRTPVGFPLLAIFFTFDRKHDFAPVRLTAADVV